ncbi:MAG TPA: hypothetical protein VMF69_16530 [Gemmataceae bacterium]|nr:hypothetical protein [Gemmataceae bacterium]
MDEIHDDRFVVYVRSRRDMRDPPEDSEAPVVCCSSYEEACRIRQAHRLHARECVIRYVGLSGGGD